jgi:hypothetical protein
MNPSTSKMLPATSAKHQTRSGGPKQADEAVAWTIRFGVGTGFLAPLTSAGYPAFAVYCQ